MKACPQCGTEYATDVRFCPLDGSTLRMVSEGEDLVGNVLADRYHVLKKLGEGGMGQVYLAEHVKMGRRSAVKVLSKALASDPDAISRFHREAANASRITHQHVAAIYDFGETTDGLIYLAMEFVEGEPLTGLLDRQKSLPPARAAELIRQCADGLDAAHALGIVHRDLKPDNIMLARQRDGSDCVKVVDFGIAKAGDKSEQNVTRTGLVVGTPEYMSPEQLSGDRLDARSDVYSLGLVAFAMLTGKLPFPSETVQEALVMRLTDRPRTLAQIRPQVVWPAAVQQVMDRVLDRDLSKRYATAGEFARALQAAVRQMPETQVAEAGTQMIPATPPTGMPVIPSSPDADRTSVVEAIPATRISKAEGVPIPDEPHLPATVLSASPAASARAVGASGGRVAKDAGKSRMPLVAAGIGLLVVLGGGTALMMKNGDAANPDAGPAQAGTEAAATVPPADAGKVSAAYSDSVTRVLDAMETEVLTADAAGARRILSQVNAIPEPILTNDQKVKAAIVRSAAFSAMDDGTSACDALAAVRPIATSSAHAANYAAMNSVCGGR